MIEAASDLTLANALTTLYQGLAAAIASGAVVGLVGLWISGAVKGPE